MNAMAQLRKIPREVESRRQRAVVCVAIGFSWALQQTGIVPVLTEAQVMSIHASMLSLLELNRRLVTELVEVKKKGEIAPVPAERLSFLSRSRRTFTLNMLRHFCINAELWDAFSLLVPTLPDSLRVSLFNYTISAEPCLTDPNSVPAKDEARLQTLCRSLLLLELLARNSADLQHRLLQIAIEMSTMKTNFAPESAAMEALSFLTIDLLSDVFSSVGPASVFTGEYNRG